MNVIRFPAWILLVAFACAAGCVTQKPTPDPLAGWKFLYSQERELLSKEITSDYEDYINKLPVEKRSFLSGVSLFEDGTGQHGVEIKIGVNGTWWNHVLIYDKDNKRIKAIKYKNGGYRS